MENRDLTVGAGQRYQVLPTIMCRRLSSENMAGLVVDEPRLAEICDRYGIAGIEVFGSVARGRPGLAAMSISSTSCARARAWGAIVKTCG